MASRITASLASVLLAVALAEVVAVDEASSLDVGSAAVAVTTADAPPTTAAAMVAVRAVRRARFMAFLLGRKRVSVPLLGCPNRQE
jgi:hypothetical protein